MANNFLREKLVLLIILLLNETESREERIKAASL